MSSFAKISKFNLILYTTFRRHPKTHFFQSASSAYTSPLAPSPMRPDSVYTDFGAI